MAEKNNESPKNKKVKNKPPKMEHLLDKVIFFGKRMKENVTEEILTAELDMSIDQITQITIEFADPTFKDLSKGIFKPRIPVVFDKYKCEVATVSTAERSGTETVTVQCRSRIVRNLKARQGRKVMKQASPTDFVKSECKALGIPLVAQPSTKRPSVRRDVRGSGEGAKKKGAGGNKFNSWTTFQRFASEIGFVVFEAGGVLYFGKPTWLLKRYRNDPFLVHWGADKKDHVRPRTVPSCSKSIDSKITTITMDLPIEYRDEIRVGHALKLSGVPEFNGHYLITGVNYSLMTTAYMTVTVTTPDDPAAAGWRKNAAKKPGSGGGDPDAEQDTASNATATGAKSATAFVKMALGQSGDTYIFGAEASVSNPNPSAFDCSELVEWAAGRVGVYIPDGSSAQAAYVNNISVAEAIRTPGALLFKPGHVAISLGNGNTIEAVGTGYGVRQMSATARSFSWTSAGKIPGMRY